MLNANVILPKDTKKPHVFISCSQ